LVSLPATTTASHSPLKAANEHSKNVGQASMLVGLHGLLSLANPSLAKNLNRRVSLAGT
jgi:hypothetical protein